MDYDKITDRGDRSQSLALVDHLKDPDMMPGERDVVVALLAQLEDHRTISPLNAMVFDTSLPDAVRKAAANAVNTFGVLAEDIAIRAWWASDDDVLKHHAIYHFNANQFDLIQEILQDDDHPFYRKAISTMAFGFHLAEHQQAKIKALRHPDPEVRKTAARVLVWDEPIEAEAALLEATTDDDSTVAAEALATLTYYQAQRVLKRAADLRDHSEGLVRTQAETTFEDLRREFCLFARGDDYLKGWMMPVMALVACDDLPADILTDDPSMTFDPGDPDTPLTMENIDHLLHNPDLPLADVRAILDSPHWGAVPLSEREALARDLMTAADPNVRSGAPAILSRWGDVDSLLMLLDDPLAWEAAVRALVDHEPREGRIADELWSHIQRHPLYGLHAADALKAYANHAPTEEMVPRMVAIAADEHQPEDQRVHAVYALSRQPETAVEVEGLMPLLEQEPQVTWALHIALLRAAETFGFLPPTEHLRDVDHLYLQEALAPFV